MAVTMFLIGIDKRMGCRCCECLKKQWCGTGTYITACGFLVGWIGDDFIYKFKIGDKVLNLEYLDKGNVPVGTKGIVIENDEAPFVKWEVGIGDKCWAQCEELMEMIK